MRPEFVDLLERVKAEHPTPPADPVKVQGELDAYLRQLGQQVARDMDLGHVQDKDLVELGYLDVAARHPDLDPDLATRLELLGHERARMGGGVPAPGNYPADRSESRPEHDWKPPGPRSDDRPRSEANPDGQTPSASRAVGKTPKDPIKDMLEFEPPDEEWS